MTSVWDISSTLSTCSAHDTAVYGRILYKNITNVHPRNST